MCGRTACTLAPDNIVRACGFRNRRGQYQCPVWKDPPGGQQYYPSHNVAPASHTPVLLSSKHYPKELESFSERVVQPMKWGLVPSWHKGDPYKLEYETNNCRAEGMLTKRTYKTPLEKGNRCVILADGFFEWKRSKEGKQPYFIYFPQDTKPDVKPDTKPDMKPDTKPEMETKVKFDLKTDPGKLETKVKPEPVDTKPDPEAAQLFVKKENEENQNDLSENSGSTSAPSSSGESFTPKKEVKTEMKTEPVWTGSGDADNAAKKMLCGEESPMKSHLTDDMKCLKADSVGEQSLAEDEEWTGKRLLTMAGVFDVWQPPDGSAPIYSYSVITVNASPAMSWIHDRMPAILSSEEEINDWLDFAEVPLVKAVKTIQSKECVTMHMVSPVVNNSRNKTPQCVEVYDPKQVKKSASSNLMMNWLSKAKPSPDKLASDAKKQKLQ